MIHVEVPKQHGDVKSFIERWQRWIERYAEEGRTFGDPIEVSRRGPVASDRRVERRKEGRRQLPSPPSRDRVGTELTPEPSGSSLVVPDSQSVLRGSRLESVVDDDELTVMRKRLEVERKRLEYERSKFELERAQERARWKRSRRGR
jgi:hypothetical protein